MTLAEAVEAKVAETGVERYRFLCLDHPDPAVRAQYSAWVMGEPAPSAPPTAYPTIPLAESMRLTSLARQCPYRSKAACGCTGSGACSLKGGVDVPTHVCWDCVRLYPL